MILSLDLLNSRSLFLTNLYVYSYVCCHESKRELWRTLCISMHKLQRWSLKGQKIECNDITLYFINLEITWWRITCTWEVKTLWGDIKTYAQKSRKREKWKFFKFLEWKDSRLSNYFNCVKDFRDSLKAWWDVRAKRRFTRIRFAWSFFTLQVISLCLNYNAKG